VPFGLTPGQFVPPHDFYELLANLAPADHARPIGSHSPQWFAAR